MPRDGEYAFVNIPTRPTVAWAMWIKKDWFTLYVDFDKDVLKMHSNDTEVLCLWFKYRVDGHLITPVSRILLDPLVSSKLTTDINEIIPGREPFSNFIWASVNTLLSGIEALGVFVIDSAPAVKQKGPNRENFSRFIYTYMKGWCPIEGSLWKDFRNGFTHAMRGTSFYENFPDRSKRWERRPPGLYINPLKLYDDFLSGYQQFIQNISNSNSLDGIYFLKQFHSVFLR